MTILMILSGGALTPSAEAASGPAPASQQRRVVSGVHADAISVFAENGGLALGSKADVDGKLGVRLDPNLTTFNVEQSRKTTIPNAPSYAFLGPPGSEVWIAPESNPGGAGLWPGFSTEGVPTGVVDGNQLTLRLEAVSGPGTLHVFQSSALGEPIRLFSSAGSDYRARTLPRGTHAHANWAFSAPGAYTLTFSANALLGGAPITATQDYRFHVGELPTAVTTTTTLATSTNAAILGRSVDLTATVTPVGAAGYVEFVDGATVLGHDAVNAGSARLTTTNVLLGARFVTARFVPQWLNDFSASTSAPVAITVTEADGVPFGVAGIATSYLPGDTLTALVVGHTLQAGQKYRWQWRVNGSAEFELGDVSTSPVFTRDLSASDNDYELSVSVWFCKEEDEYCSDGTVVAESPWVPVSVRNLGAPIVATLLSPTHAHLGDEALIAVSGRTLAEGESLQVVRRDPATGWHTWSSDELFAHQTNTVRIYLLVGGEFAVRVLNANGVAVAQSASMKINVTQYEVQIAGVHGLYRPGANLQAQGIIHPESTNLLYQWSMFVPGGTNYGILKEGSGPGADTLEIPDLTLARNAGVLFLSVSVPIGPPFVEEESSQMAGQIYVRVYVQDINPGTQIFQFQPLGDHYHQGNPIHLVLGADPQPAEGDEVVWEWRWPGGDWAALPSAAGTSHSLVAEQALDGVQVRASLVFANTNVASVGAGPVTIFVDDHGAAARQQPTVTGLTNVVAGNLVTLTRALPGSAPTILTTHRWERKGAGAAEFTVISATTNATLNFPASLADDGAQYRVSIIKPNGALAYGPSPAVTLRVSEPMPLRPVIINLGHIDLFELTWNTNSGQLDLKVKDDTTLYAPDVAFRQPENVTILVDTALSEQMLGNDDLAPGYDFIPRNQPFYLLDWSQQDGLPWPGWSTERLLGSLPKGVTIPYDSGSVEFGVTVEGPGDVVTFIDEGFGTPSNRFIDTTDTEPDVIVTGSSIHYHTAWLFTKPGDYLLTVTPRAYPSFPSKANPLTGPAHVYHFHVGPSPKFEAVPEGFQMSIAGAPFSVTNDTPVNLQLVLSGPEPAIGGYQWYHFVAGAGQQPIAGATNLAVSLTVDPWDSAQAVLFDPTGRVLTQTGVQFLPSPGPPGVTMNVSGYSDGPNTAGVSWATVYDGRSALTRQVVTLIPQVGAPIVQEVTGSVNDAAFSSVPVGTYTATVQAINALGAGAVSAPSSSFTVLPSLSIAQTGAAPGTVTLVIATRGGKIHQLESAPAVTGPWTNLGDPINGTGQTVTVSLPLNGPAGFFRWRLVGEP